MKYLLTLFTLFILGCYNNPTPPSEITGARVSGVFYKQLDCEALNEEIIFLTAREKELIVLQEIRIIESRSQQVWANGNGKGDGVEASELHQVKGEIFAARKVFQNKGCM
tara:strand:- start:1249 stop:1578 length:330 start_codon:yes stop_codon:yes gene_type:complete